MYYIQQLSHLKTVKAYDIVPVPGFDDDGNLDPKQVQTMSTAEFLESDHHQSRVLIGNSNGPQISQTVIPEGVSNDTEARKMYQTHVFLHEFFHTIELPLKKN